VRLVLYPFTRYCPAMAAELEQALAHALQFDGRKQFRVSGETMARITAAHVVEQLGARGLRGLSAIRSAWHWALVAKCRPLSTGCRPLRGLCPQCCWPNACSFAIGAKCVIVPLAMARSEQVPQGGV
jgi:hypothetical protein